MMDAFKKFLPEELDTSYWNQLRLSGSSAKSLRLAVKHLGLIDDNHVVQDKLRRLVRASNGEGQESKSEVLTQVLSDAYPYLFEPEGKLAGMTQGQLAAFFEKSGAKGQMQQKCMTFFLSLASETDMKLSPHLAGKSRLGVGRKSITMKRKQKGGSNHEQPEDPKTGGLSMEIHRLPPAIAGLMRELPTPGSTWRRGGKDRFMGAFGAVLDLLYPSEE